MRRFLFLLLLVGLTFSCAQREITTPEPGKVIPSEKVKAEQPREEAPNIVGEEEVPKIETTEIEKAPSAIKVSEKEQKDVLKDIHFDFDRYDVKDADKPVLRAIADWMLDNPADRLVIEGNCDERGTSEYNLGLGDRRATSTKDYLITLGVSADRLQTVSYGEEKPLCTESNEACWAKNRRAHFVVLKQEAGK
ncbi:MAG TPA: peptidoglycan-associated lipoprotein Pal [Nitrospirae bacterium]|nr:peptidoglycan-associated lipoprotein Pal [Nitrospirota bacterium]